MGLYKFAECTAAALRPSICQDGSVSFFCLYCLSSVQIYYINITSRFQRDLREKGFYFVFEIGIEPEPSGTLFLVKPKANCHAVTEPTRIFIDGFNSRECRRKHLKSVSRPISSTLLNRRAVACEVSLFVPMFCEHLSEQSQCLAGLAYLVICVITRELKMRMYLVI